MTKPRILILAPHVDDEVIGCSSVLRDAPEADIRVVWFNETTPERVAEGNLVASLLGYTTVTAEQWGDNLKSHLLKRGDYDEVYVPSRSDAHIDHKTINSRFANIATHFYSVDMVNARPLPEPEQQVKRALLRMFASQSKLLESDDKYWLFEDIRRTDWVEIETLHFNTTIVSVEASIADKVKEEFPRDPLDREGHLKTFRWLCSLTLEQVVYSWWDEGYKKNITWRTQ